MRPHIERLEERQFLTTVPSGFVDSTVFAGLDEPTAMVQTPDGRILVAEQDGDLRVIQNNQLLPTPMLSLTSDNSVNERGFLGVEIDPNFASNGFLYTYYTSTVGGVHNHVTRWTVNGNIATG